MNTETLEYKGYKIEVAQDEYAENPFKAWDCEPPLLAFYGDRHGDLSTYQDAPATIGEVIRLMPAACFQRGQRVALIKALLNCTLKEFAEVVREYGDVQSAFIQLAGEQVGTVPEGWRSAIEWFDMAKSLLNWAGIPCLNTQSNGYCQGDSTLLLVILTPDWVKTVGASPEHNASNLQGAADLYSAWAWGDVYGVSTIHTPSESEDEQGEEIEDGSCWGFYGQDHEKSGLMDHARNAIDWHIKNKAQAALNEPACLI
jgi:hypothetical protein